MSLFHATEQRLAKIYDTIGLRVEPWPTFLLGLAILLVAFVFMPSQATLAFELALFLAPLWLPILLVSSLYHLWYTWQQSEFIAKQDYVLLELTPPRSLVKTPLAMEAFLSTLHLTGGESTWWARFTGGIRPYFSLEIVSFEGQVHFYIWTRASLRRLIESQLYAQYPGVHITEAVDYTRLMELPSEGWDLWGCSYKHTAPDPLPIKTYVEYGLDKVQKEPEQVDPLAQLTEFMGSIGKGEYLWLQYVVRAHKGEKYRGKKTAEGKAYTWRDHADELVKKIREQTRDSYIDVFTGQERPGFPNPTKGQIEKIAAIERNVSKLAFDVGARCVYIAKPANFHGPTIAHMIALFKPFSTEGWNGINSTKWLKSFDDFPWEFGLDRKKEHYRHELIEAYRRRQFVYDPFFEGELALEDLMIMSTEELATIFHIPSSSVETPGLGRTSSTTADAPVDLPV
jgi:hypothetical protein